MHMRRIFVCFATAAAVATVATAAGAPAAGATTKAERFAFVLNSCPFVGTGGTALLFNAAPMVSLPADSGFACPIDQLPLSG